MRVTFRSQQKVMRIFIPRNTLVGATVGVTPALIVLTAESEVSKNGIRNCIRRSRDDGHVCIDSRALPARRVNAQGPQINSSAAISCLRGEVDDLHRGLPLVLRYPKSVLAGKHLATHSGLPARR